MMRDGIYIVTRFFYTACQFSVLTPHGPHQFQWSLCNMIVYSLPPVLVNFLCVADMPTPLGPGSRIRKKLMEKLLIEEVMSHLFLVL